jgi:S1-C subfamily serine protease
MFSGLAVASLLAVPSFGMAAPNAKTADKPYLGIGVEPATKATGLTGVTLREVDGEGPAGKAGLRPGDRIVAAGDQKINSFEDIKNTLASHKSGDKLVFKAVRGGAEQDFAVVLGEVPGQPTASLPPAVQPRTYLGIHTRPITAELQSQLGLRTAKGAVVVHVLPESPAAEAGLAADDVVTHVGAVAVASPEELREAVQKLSAGKEVTLKVVRGEQERELQARLREAPPAFAFSDDVPELPEGFRGLNGPSRPFAFTAEKLTALEKKVQELEKRVHELEKMLAK